MEYPLSLEYYRKQLKVVMHDAVMRFELLEQLLTKNKLERYLAIKKKVENSIGAQVRNFNLLFDGILNDKISDLDIEIYCNNFEPNQHIKYFLDYFRSTKTTENYSPKGTTVELKAYGTSKKINREVIAFTGSFRDNLLNSFSDKTSEACSFRKIIKATDFYKNDINLIKLLLENDLLEILSDTSLNSIVSADANTIFLLYNENKLGLVNPNTINQLARFHYVVFEFLFKKRELKILSTETIKYQVDKETSEINSKFNELLTFVKEAEFLYDEQDCFYVKQYQTPVSMWVGEEYVFDDLTYLKVDEIIETFENEMNMKSYFINRNNITEEDKNYLQTIFKSDIDDKIKAVIAMIKVTIHERIKAEKKKKLISKFDTLLTFVKEAEFLYDEQDCFYVEKHETPESIQVGKEYNFGSGVLSLIEYLKVDEIIETFENEMNMKSNFINRNNITEEDKNYLQTIFKSDIDYKIKAVIAEIKETIHERIKAEKETTHERIKAEKKRKLIGYITVVVILIILFLIRNWLVIIWNWFARPSTIFNSELACYNLDLACWNPLII